MRGRPNRRPKALPDHRRRRHVLRADGPGGPGLGKVFSSVAFLKPLGIMNLLLGNLSISRHGKSSVECVFSDDLKPDGREQSGKEQSVQIRS
jgi:hypothetical protein